MLQIELQYQGRQNKSTVSTKVTTNMRVIEENWFDFEN